MDETTLKYGLWFGNFGLCIFNLAEFIIAIIYIMKYNALNLPSDPDYIPLQKGTLAVAAILIIVYGGLAYMTISRSSMQLMKISLTVAAVTYVIFLILGAASLTQSNFASDLNSQASNMQKLCDNPPAVYQTMCDEWEASYRYFIMTAIAIPFELIFLGVVGVLGMKYLDVGGGQAAGGANENSPIKNFQDNTNKSMQMSNRPLTQEQYNNGGAPNGMGKSNMGGGSSANNNNMSNFSPNYPQQNPVYQNQNPTLTPTPSLSSSQMSNNNNYNNNNYNNNYNNNNNNTSNNNNNNYNNTLNNNRPPNVMNSSYGGGANANPNNVNQYNNTNINNNNYNNNANIANNPPKPGGPPTTQKRNYY